MSRQPLKMKCPKCGNYTECKSVHFDDNHYRWDDEMTEFFKKIAGQDISFRKRTRQCSVCWYEFPVVEMPKLFLNCLIDQIKKLNSSVISWENENRRLQEENNQLKATLKNLKEAMLKTINDSSSIP